MPAPAAMTDAERIDRLERVVLELGESVARKNDAHEAAIRALATEIDGIIRRFNGAAEALEASRAKLSEFWSREGYEFPEKEPAEPPAPPRGHA